MILLNVVFTVEVEAVEDEVACVVHQEVEPHLVDVIETHTTLTLHRPDLTPTAETHTPMTIMTDTTPQRGYPHPQDTLMTEDLHMIERTDFHHPETHMTDTHPQGTHLDLQTRTLPMIDTLHHEQQIPMKDHLQIITVDTGMLVRFKYVVHERQS